MIDLGTFQGKQGCEVLLRAVNDLLREKGKVVIALAGLPGSGKTHVAKQFVRFGFGSIPRRDITVIDDNTVYTTRFWRLHWDKLPGEKKIIGDFVGSASAKVIFFSNWIPGRFLDNADIMIFLTTDEEIRLARLQRRYRHHPDKFLIQKEKRTIPLEDSFRYGKSLTLINNSREITAWLIQWMIKRIITGICNH
ncbi:MAG: AAA family ATPase [Deltaproteobacteria bacterium]|nr:AAA family ATPase [Deltaproteobacteria bacterium]